MNFSYRLLAETITTDDRGDTIEGSSGLLDSFDEYVPMDGYSGSIARKILDDNTRTASMVELRDILRDHGPADHVDVRSDDEAIIYLADLPAVGDDEPYVRAIWVEGPDVVERLTNPEALIERAREDGREAGRSAGSWVEIADVEDARSIVEDVDPMVLDRYEPSAPLSGEFADGPTVRTLADDYGLDYDEDVDELDEIAEAFEDGFYQGYSEALDQAAHAFLDAEDATA